MRFMFTRVCSIICSIEFIANELIQLPTTSKVHSAANLTGEYGRYLQRIFRCDFNTSMSRTTMSRMMQRRTPTFFPRTFFVPSLLQQTSELRSQPSCTVFRRRTTSRSRKSRCATPHYFFYATDRSGRLLPGCPSEAAIMALSFHRNCRKRTFC